MMNHISDTVYIDILEDNGICCQAHVYTIVIISLFLLYMNYYEGYYECIHTYG